jgi:signal transduction histidine kinase
VRQQIKWLLVPAAVGILFQLVGVPLYGRGSTAWAIGAVLSMLGQPVTVVGATVGILRYRLWEMEIVVSRALVWGVLWIVLTAVLLVPALAAGLLVGGSGALAAVALALLVTIVFQPAARRLERLAERLVYRHRARPHVLMTSFWELLRSTVDPAALGPLVAGAVREGLAVPWAGVWTAGPAGVLRPLGVSGAAAGPRLELPPEVVAFLRRSAGLVLARRPPEGLAVLWPSPPAAVVPLAGGDELVGVLACGQRRGDQLGSADFELLELLGRECALRLRNLGLESQLRERLGQIEQQAEELRRSRQRLVTAQDEERRRIERDVHDGVQQQLVALAIRLRRAVDGLEADAAALVGDLAAEAEDAVFALQELGRGIFPTVLADRGLTAALRTHAARIPTAVRVDADPSIAGRRLEPEHEAALYFVALEALANAQKHAPGATATVALRFEAGCAVLEVRDDGPGFDPGRAGPGTGRQNMADRIAAIGGELVVETSRSGTVVRASVPQAAPVTVSPTPTPAGR